MERKMPSRKKADRERPIQKTAEGQQPIVTSARLEVSKDGEVKGKYDDPDAKERPYGASSVIERGTAAAMKFGDADLSKGRTACICGCGKFPNRPESLFMPGHDSKVRAMGVAIERGDIDRKKIPEPALKYLVEGGMLKEEAR
jgi:hypothetical protein